MVLSLWEVILRYNKEMVNTFLKDVAVQVQSFHNDLPYTSIPQMYITFFFLPQIFYWGK